MNGPLVNELKEFLDVEGQDIEFVPFQWSGANSQRERISAGKELRRRIRELLVNTQGKIIVIAHSHGGNVAHHAIIEDRQLSSEPRVEIVTVGTPFFAGAADSIVSLIKKHIVFLLPATLLASVAALVLFFVGDTRSIGLSQYWFLNSVLEGALWLAIIGWFSYVIALPVAFFQVARVDPRTTTHKKRKETARLYFFINRLYLGLIIKAATRRDHRHGEKEYNSPRIYSRNDEAINALAVAPQQDISIATYGLLRWPVVLVLSLAVFVILTNTFSHNEVPKILDSLATWAADGVSHQLNVLFVDDDEFYDLSPRAATTVGLALFSLMCSLLLYRLGLGRLSVFLVNALIKQGLIDKAYGNDGRFSIGWVAANPPRRYMLHQQWKPLPRDIDAKFDVELNVLAATALSTARQNLGIAAISGANNIEQTIFGSLTLNELVHTSYFDHIEVRHLIAWYLVNRFGLKASDQFKAKVDADRCKQIHNHIRPTHYTSFVAFLRRFVRTRLR